MRKIGIALALAAFVTGHTSASAQALSTAQNAVLVPIRQFEDAFNKGDTKGVVAACVNATSIIDEFPPYEWHGTGACAKWMADYDTDAKKNAITDGIVTLGKPSHVDISGDRAYVVIPTNYTYKQGGKPMEEVGSIFTFALKKGPAGWQVMGWSWGKH